MYKLILTDINMPEMDGFQMSKAIKQAIHSDQSDQGGEAEETHIVAVTAMNDQQIKDVYKGFGIETVLTKPVKFSDLKPIFQAAFNQ